MKNNIIVFFLLLVSQLISAQDIQECRNLVTLTTEAINDQSIEKLKPHLADDFELKGVSTEMATMVLTQLISQLNDEVVSYKEIDAQKGHNQLKLIYQVIYKNRGKRDITFIFNPDNKLKVLELLQLKVLKKEKTKVQVPSKNIISIPFRQVGNLILVEVVVNGQSRNFLLDTGAPDVILNAEYYHREDTIQTLKINSSKGINGAISDVDFVTVESLDFFGLKINDQKVIVTDLSRLEVELETEIYGLIGYEMIKNYDILYDYGKKRLTLIKPNYFETFKKQQWTKNTLTIVPFDLQKHLPLIQIKIGKKKYTMAIDSGAETNILDSNYFDAAKPCLRKISVDTIVGVGPLKEATKAIVKKLHIGDKKFKKTITLFTDLSHLNEGYQIQVDGLVGYEILSKQKTLVSYARKEMIFID